MIGFGTVLFLGLIALANVLNIGERLSRLHPALEFAFYALVLCAIYGLLIRPVLSVISMTTHPLQRVLVSDSRMTQKEYKAVAKRFLQSGGLSAEAAKRLEESVWSGVGLEQEVKAALDEKRARSSQIVKDHARLAFLSTAVIQNGSLDALMLAYKRVGRRRRHVRHTRPASGCPCAVARDGERAASDIGKLLCRIVQRSRVQAEEVQTKWAGKTYKTLHPDDRRRLDNSILHAIVVRQDEPTEDQSSIYLIFERLNSGGTILQSQEIRVALYHGPFATLLSDLNDNPDWRAVYGPKNARLKDIELILRFLSLYFHRASYERPMKAFLNRYVAANRSLQKQPEDVIRPLFEKTVHAIRTGIGEKAFRPFGGAVNAAVMDALLYGVASRLASGALSKPGALKSPLETLLKQTVSRCGYQSNGRC